MAFDKNLGMIFNIQRYSIHDGPGIRTLIFLKGCPLRCLWCSNPEGQSTGPDIMFAENKCIKCYNCFKLCSINAISIENNTISINRRICNYCGVCTSNCFPEALKFVGKYISIKEALKIIEKDNIFYKVSSGGVTLSGGEPLMQIKFVKELFEACKLKKINTAIETSGYVKWEDLKSIIYLTDTFFYDIKHMSPTKHFELTGASNKIILENLKKLSKLHNNIIIRMPLIIGYNDQTENLKLMADFLNKLKKIKYIEILSYHEFGKNKYAQLGKKYRILNTKHINNPIRKDLKKIEDFFNNNTNLKVILNK